MSQEAKEQLAKTLTQLARELSDSGGQLLSDTIDANHLACYLISARGREKLPRTEHVQR